jgi:hypothetical protein
MATLPPFSLEVKSVFDRGFSEGACVREINAFPMVFSMPCPLMISANARGKVQRAFNSSFTFDAFGGERFSG